MIRELRTYHCTCDGGCGLERTLQGVDSFSVMGRLAEEHGWRYYIGLDHILCPACVSKIEAMNQNA